MIMGAFLKQGGGYRNLRVYKVTEIIYDITFYFAYHYLSKGDRTIDQMVQAARSGKQNIAEGSEASTTSREMEIKLTNVAKASLEELLRDYGDYLRVRNIPRWDKSHPRYEKMRAYAKSEKLEHEYPQLIKRLSDEEISNLCITLINQATYMLRKLINKQQEQFLKEGGIREQMKKARIEYKKSCDNKDNDSQKKSDSSDPSDLSDLSDNKIKPKKT